MNSSNIPRVEWYAHTYTHMYIHGKVSSKLEGWDSQLLTTAGRAKLIHSTITSTFMYWLLIYHLPLSVPKKID